MCMSTPMVILVLFLEVLFFGFLIVTWIKKTSENEAERYKTPPPKIDPRFTYEMLEQYLKTSGEAPSYSEEESKAATRDVMLLATLALVAAGFYLYLAL